MPIEGARRWGAELALFVVAGAASFGFLGSTELWGKREQRASAEALDTVDRGHWLVAEIQGRPRLEKPPLPRWITSALILATGRRDEAIVRLPNALAALLTVGLVYAMGRRLGGRPVALASGFALASSAYFLVEMRQAGNDGLLALFTTLALLSARERLGDDEAGDAPGPRRWAWLFHTALGLGFLTKGPVILLFVGLPLIGSLATTRRLARGLRALADGPALALFAAMALAWPVPVLLRDPGAARLWWLEMGQKSGALAIVHGNERGSVVLDWFWMTLPWTPLACLAAVAPLRRSAQDPTRRAGAGLAWWWAFGNLAMLGLWKVAKPSYYLPCLPAVALLVGAEWVRLARLARVPGSIAARASIQAGWVALFVAAAVGAVVVGETHPHLKAWAGVAAMAVAGSTVLAVRAWRRGLDAAPLGFTGAGVVAVALIAYGAVAPLENARRGHRALARDLDRIIPDSSKTVYFFDDVDEGLWFYLRRHDLTPISRLQYNRGFDLRDQAQSRRVTTPRDRVAQARDRVANWARQVDPGSPYLLIRGKVYDLPGFAEGLKSLVEPVHREAGLDRNELVLLRARANEPVATREAARR